MSSSLPVELQTNEGPSPLIYSKVLLVEGKTPLHFFKALLKDLGLLADIEVRDFGGVTEFSVYLETLMITPGFSDVISLGVVRDAEVDAQRAFASVGGSLKRAGLDVPAAPMTITDGNPKVSVYILPDCAAPGMIETLCMEAVKNDPVVACINQYFECLAEGPNLTPLPLDKALIQAFLASREKPGLLLGQAAHAGFLPWNNTAFDQLKKFLRAL